AGPVVVTYSRVTSGASYNFLPGGAIRVRLDPDLQRKDLRFGQDQAQRRQLLDGSTLELRWDNGTVDRRTFLWGNRADKKAFQWGTQAWLRKE
ncbi:MAG TPA: hypothetical protein VFD36_21540, partial [Kofleriaceae bacterium]|nr:hypothetical protein [Kofleriaceae bacterium]